MAEERWFGTVTYSSSQYRGHLWCQKSATTVSSVTLQAYCQAQRIPKNYGRWLRAQVGYATSSTGSASNLGDSGSVYMSSYSGGAAWENFCETGTKSITINRGAKAQTIYINAWYRVSDSGNPSSDPGGGTSARDWVAFTIPALDPPAAPTGLSVSYNPTSLANSINWAWSSTTSIVSTFDIYRSDNAGSFVRIAQGLAAGTRSYTDTAVSPNHTYIYQVVAINAAASTTATSPKLITAATPAAPTACTATRTSDISNTVSWKNTASNAAPYGSLLLQRSVDGAGFSTLATLAGTATGYTDTSTSANHYYRYQICAQNLAGNSAYAQSAYTYNTPSAPGTPTASRVSETKVGVSFANTGVTETATELQRSSDGGATWETVSIINATDIIYIEDSPGGGTYWYRVRNMRGSLASAWSAVSNSVVTVIAPNPPALISPSQGEIQSTADPLAAFAWRHSPIDGSAQTGAQLRYSTDGGTIWVTATIQGNAQTYTLTPTFAANTTILWQVCTKGAHADYSSWSSVFSTTIYAPPTLAITSPANDGDSLTDMPLVVAWEYSDVSGTQQQATIEILDASGRVVYKKVITGQATACDITVAEFLPTNGQTYTLSLTARSTSSLNTQTTRIFNVAYIPPGNPTAYLTIDKALASVRIDVIADSSSAIATVSLGIYRKMPDGRLVDLGQELADFSSVIDRLAPVAIDYSYLIVAYNQSGLTSVTEVPCIINTGGCTFFNFGDGHVQVAKLKGNQAASWAHSNTVNIFETAGTREPLAFWGVQEQSSGNESGLIGHSRLQAGQPGDPSLLADFQSLASWHGDVVLRRPMRDPVLVAVTGIDASNEVNIERVSVSVAWRRVRNHGLAI